MTIREILRALEPQKPMSVATLYQHLRALKIKPLGPRQIPQQYPADAAARILIRLGFKQPKTNGRRSHARRQLQKEAA